MADGMGKCKNCRIISVFETRQFMWNLLQNGCYSHIFIGFLIVIFSCIGTSVPQIIHSVTVPPLEAVRIGSNARLTCRFHGTKFQIQYISWTKVFIGGGKAHVYGYDKCSGENNGFYDLENRSILDVASPSALRHTRSISPTASSDQPIGPMTWERDSLHTVYDIHESKRTVLSYDGKSVRTIDNYGDGIQIPPDQEILTGSATLTIKDVRLEDEARYECLVKPVKGPAETDIQLLTVVVLPTTPRVKVPQILVENRNYTFQCNAFVGRPTGAVQWFIKRVGGAFKMMADEKVDTHLTHYSNGTSSAESHLVLNVTEDIHSAILRCEVSSRAMRPWERRPFHQQRLNVLYPPRKGRILYDSRTKRYYCDAEGNPKSTYIWMWVLGDGTKTILSTSHFLDLSPIQSTGIFQFQCLASNMIETKRHTIVMKTKIKIQGTTTKTPTTTTISPTVNTRNVVQNENNTSSMWNMGYGEPYDFEKVAPKKHFDIRGEPVPVWDIIHGYVGHDQNPVSSSNYNISVISQTLGNKEDTNNIQQVQAKNSASSYIQVDNLESKLSTNKLDSTNRNKENGDEPIVVYLPKRSNSTLTPKYQESTASSETTDSAEPSRSADQNFKLPETEISEMSPENYDYGDDTEENESAGSAVKSEQESIEPEEVFEEPENESNTQSPVEVAEQATDDKETDKEPLEEDQSVKDSDDEMPLLPPITLSELLSGRYKKTRPSKTSRKSNEIVPYNKNGKPDYRKILKVLPSSQKRYVRRRIANINRKFNRFLIKYREQLLAIEGKEGQSINENSFSDSTQNVDLYGMYNDDSALESADYYSNLDYNLQPELPHKVSVSENSVPNYSFEQPLLSTVLQSQGQINTDKYGILLHDGDTTPAPEGPILPLQIVNPPDSVSNRRDGNHGINQFTEKSSSDLENILKDYYSQNYVLGHPSVGSDNMQEKNSAFSSNKQLSDVHNVDSVMKDFNSHLASKYPEYTRQHGFSESNYDTNNILTAYEEKLPSYTPYDVRIAQSQVYPSARPYPRHSTTERRVNGDYQVDWDRAHGQSAFQKMLPESKQSTDFGGNNEYMDEFEVLRAADKEFNCKDKEDGPYGGGCRGFYRCVDGTSYKVDCRPPYVFNEGTGHCDDASKTTTACGEWKDCRNKPNGKYTDTARECKFYFTCYQGMFLGHNECNPGTVFNEKEQVCDWPNNLPQPCGNG